MKSIYDSSFFQNQGDTTFVSARRVVPILINLLHPKSVVDFGCGTGTWLRVFKENGINNILGLDGEYVDKSQLKISESDFRSEDLSIFFKEKRKFDLAICLEVAEHIEQEYEDIFIKNLVQLSDIIFFSAAIPFQGGTHHVNEQWQEYWIHKFKLHGYQASGWIRDQIWNDDKIQTYYRQNNILFYKTEAAKIILKKYPTLSKSTVISVVHPDYYLSNIELQFLSISTELKKICHLFWYKIRKYVKKNLKKTSILL